MPWPPPAFHVMIKPCDARCNLSCKYCFYLDKERLYPGSDHLMSDAVLDKFTRQYIAGQQVPEVTFGWQGGEPTLAGIDFFKRAIALQKKHAKPGRRVLNTIQTNGTLINDEWASFFKDNNFLVGISIDGPPAIHDTYRVDKGGNGSLERVARGLDVLKKHGVEFNVLACVHAESARHPLDVYRYFRDTLGVKFIQFIPVVEKEAGGSEHQGLHASPRSVTGKELGEFLVTIFDEWVTRDVGDVFVQLFDVALAAWLDRPGAVCVHAPICGNALAIEFNGDIYACDHFVQPDQRRGNIMDAPLASLVTGAAQKAFGLAKRDALPGCCKSCSVLFACHGGCPKDRIDRSPAGEPGLNHLCEGYKAFFTHVDPHMRFMATQVANGRPATLIMDQFKHKEH